MVVHRYQIALQEVMKGSDFAFNHVDGLHYMSNKIILDHGGSYVDSRDWIKYK